MSREATEKDKPKCASSNSVVIVRRKEVIKVIAYLEIRRQSQAQFAPHHIRKSEICCLL